MRIVSLAAFALALLALSAQPTTAPPPPVPVPPAVALDTVPDDSASGVQLYLVGDSAHTYACATFATADGHVALGRPVLHMDRATAAVSILKATPGIELCTQHLAQRNVRLTTQRWKTVSWVIPGLVPPRRGSEAPST